MSAIQEELLIKIAADLSDLKKGMDTAEKSLKQGKESAQGFSGGIENITENLKMFNTNIGGVNVNVGHMAQNTKKLITSIKGATVSTRAFGTALAATGIGAIVVALGLLFSAFSSTQEGSDKLNKVLTPLKAVFGALFGVIQNLSLMLSDKLVAAFKDPQQAVKDLWESIKQNLLNRLDGVIKAVQAAGKVIGASFRLDFEAAGEAAKDFGSAMLQASTGILDLEGKTKAFVEDLVDAAKNGQALGGEIEKLNVKIRKAELEAIKRRESLNLAAREGERIATDTKLTEEERLKGLEQAKKATSELSNLEQHINNLKLKRIKLENAINDTSDADLAAQYEIEAANIRLNAQLEEQARKYNRIKNGIKEIKEDLIEIPDFEFFDVDRTEEEAQVMKEVFVDIKGEYQNLADSINETAIIAERFADIIGNTTAVAFDVLLDKTKNFDDFADIMGETFKRIIADMAATAVKALALQAILSAFGISQGVGFKDTFKQLLGLNVGGDAAGVFGQVSGDSLFLSGSRAANGNNRSGR